MLCDLIFFKKFFCFAMAYTQKQHINVIIEVARKFEFCFTGKITVNMAYRIAAVAFAMDETDSCFRVVDKKPDQFTACVTGTTYYPYFKFFHWLLLLPGDRSSFGCRRSY